MIIIYIVVIQRVNTIHPLLYICFFLYRGITYDVTIQLLYSLHISPFP